MIIDCIEFNPRYRVSDPVADMAFLVMDLIRHGRRDLRGGSARLTSKPQEMTMGGSWFGSTWPTAAW